MNDRFKFRVWDKRKNNYIKDFVFNFINKLPYITVEYFDNEYEYTHTFEKDEIIIEQCTGLKDKTGKLIYEGDIILVEDNKCPIEWEFENARYNVVGYGEIAYLNYNDIEVIGNIHENADLLENEEW